MEMQADIRILSKVILKIKKIEDPGSLLYGTVKCKRLYKERVECYEIHGTMPRGIRALLVSTKEISHKLGIEEKDCERLLDHLKQLEPAGVFAESVSECLLLQLEEKEY